MGNNLVEKLANAGAEIIFDREANPRLPWTVVDKFSRTGRDEVMGIETWRFATKLEATLWRSYLHEMQSAEEEE